MNQEEFLAHYGVKGMKWGVRRQRGSNGRVQPRVSSERKAADRIRDKSKEHGRRSLTNKELADYNKRLELENKYAKLKKGDVTATTAVILAGAAFAGGIAMNVARTHAQNEASKKVAVMLANRAAKNAPQGRLF